MKDRIKQIMDAKQMSQQAFAAFIDISPATLSSIFNGRTKPTLVIVEAIKKKIPDINTDWLMFGSGNMFSTLAEAPSGSTSPAPESEEKLLDFDFDENDAMVEEPRNDAQVVAETKSVKNTPKETPKTEIKYIDKPQRHVVEIKVYYDDYTYESFYPSPKK